MNILSSATQTNSTLLEVVLSDMSNEHDQNGVIKIALSARYNYDILCIEP